MFGPRPSILDQVRGARAAGALLAGELDEAHEHLSAASSRYLAGFLLRRALVTPGVSILCARVCCGGTAGDDDVPFTVPHRMGKAAGLARAFRHPSGRGRLLSCGLLVRSAPAG